MSFFVSPLHDPIYLAPVRTSRKDIGTKKTICAIPPQLAIRAMVPSDQPYAIWGNSNTCIMHMFVIFSYRADVRTNFKSTNEQADHLISMTAAITLLQTCRLVATLRLLCPWLGERVFQTLLSWQLDTFPGIFG